MTYRATTVLLFCFLSSSAFSDLSSSEQIDRDTWSVISKSVKDADIKAMASTYHPDAVVVTGTETIPVSVALSNWGEGMEKATASGSRATVSFRFKHRQDDENSAFEVGVFKYISIDASGNKTQMYMNFESLLVKQNGLWRFMMERQLDLTDEVSWQALE